MMTVKKKASIRELVRGKVRRFMMAHKRQGKDYIRRMLKRRRGRCARCGVCCRLVHRCPFLLMDHGMAICTIHALRPANCRIFPVDSRDLAERDQIAPHRPCGYTFVAEHESA